MSATVEVDFREWNAALRLLWNESSRELEDFVNGQAFRVAYEAIKQTKITDRAKLIRQLGATQQYKPVRQRKTGKIYMKRNGVTMKKDSFAERILYKRYAEYEKWGIRGETMDQMVRNLVAARIRSIAFIKSGWIPAVQALARVIKRKPNTSGTLQGAKIYGKKKGGAVPCRYSWNKENFATITNTALMTRRDKLALPAQGGNPMPIAEKGLQAALNVATRDMLQHLADKLGPTFKKVSAK